MQVSRAEDNKDVINLYLTPDEATSIARGLKYQAKRLEELMREGREHHGVSGINGEDLRINIALDIEGLDYEEESRLWKILLNICGDVYHDCDRPLIEPESSVIVKQAWNHIDKNEYEEAYQAFMKLVPYDPRLKQIKRLLNILTRRRDDRVQDARTPG